jgi:hypothetical protein
MAKIFSALVVMAAMFFGIGMAEAAPATYEISKTWTLTDVNGRPTIQPRIENDTLDVICRNSNHMTTYKVSNPKLVTGAWKKTDGTGIQVEPNFTKTGQRLTITATCKRS